PSRSVPTVESMPLTISTTARHWISTTSPPRPRKPRTPPTQTRRRMPTPTSPRTTRAKTTNELWNPPVVEPIHREIDRQLPEEQKRAPFAIESNRDRQPESRFDRLPPNRDGGAPVQPSKHPIAE